LNLTSLVYLENSLDPGDDLVGGGIGGLVKVDDSIALELFKRSARG